MIDHQRPWDRPLQTLLALVLVVNTVVHVGAVPYWALGTTLACVAWKMLHLYRAFPLPKRWVLNLASLGVGFVVFRHFGTIIGQEAAAALLVSLAGLKLMETNRYQDAMFVVLTSYFLLMSHVLDSQSLLTTIYMVVDALAITALMFHMHRPERGLSLGGFAPVLRLFALSVPVWILFFFVFPRFTTVFWNLKTSPPTIGFSDQLNPGSVESLTENEETAFRVNFAGRAVPSPDWLYWRGGILLNSDGLRWSRAAVAAGLGYEPMNERAAGATIDYEVWLEPGLGRWLFFLDYPVTYRVPQRGAGPRARRAYGYIWQADRDVQTRTVYGSSAARWASTYELNLRERAMHLQLPRGLDPRVVELAERLKVPGNPEKSADRLALWFQEQKFLYTRRPGPLASADGAGQLAEFLFETKRGFCEHFAASYATVLRAMDVPTRVVIGYQGGKVNEYGQYLIVRQVDAHAWTEYWRPTDEDPRVGRWVRVDPTEVVAPLRIQLGGDFNRLDPGTFAEGATTDDIRRTLDGGLGALFRKAELAWDVVQMNWNMFLIRYDFEYQLELLKELGIEHGSRALLFGALVLGLLFTGTTISWALRRRSASGEDPALKEWRGFSRKLERIGLERRSNEGPRTYAARLARALPERKSEIESIAEKFIALRYGNEPKATLADLRQSVRRFSIDASSREVSS